MTTLNSQSVIAIGAASTAAVASTLLVLPVAAAGSGSGRLIHPTLGTYDYNQAPDEWVNIRGDVIIEPVWASSVTLSGNANTLWPGGIKDVVVEERWKSEFGLSMTTGHLQQLINMFVAPPDPDTDYVQWWPSYDSVLGFDVVLLSLSVGGKGVTIDRTIKATATDGDNYVRGAVVLTMRIVARV